MELEHANYVKESKNEESNGHINNYNFIRYIVRERNVNYSEVSNEKVIHSLNTFLHRR